VPRYGKSVRRSVCGLVGPLGGLLGFGQVIQPAHLDCHEPDSSFNVEVGPEGFPMFFLNLSTFVVKTRFQPGEEM
jgi:hypothetical protein